MDEANPLDMLVIKYLDNEMSGNEKEVFEARLLSEPLLKSKLESLRLALDAVYYQGIHHQVSEVRKFYEGKNNDHAKPATTGLPPVRRFVQIPVRRFVQISLAAASVLFAFLMIRALYFAPVSAEKIYNDVYVGYQVSSMRSVGDSLNSLEKAYQENKYGEVTSLSRDSLKSAKDQLLLGISLLNVGQAAKAVPVLEDVIKDPGKAYLQDAQFYLGLAYLKAGLPEKSLALLSAINATPEHPYQKQVSAKTLEQIRKLR